MQTSLISIYKGAYGPFFDVASVIFGRPIGNFAVWHFEALLGTPVRSRYLPLH